MLGCRTSLLSPPGPPVSTLLGGRVGEPLSAVPVPPLADRPQQAQWGQTERRATAKGLAILAVEGRGVAARVLGRRIALRSAGPAAALTAPAHRLAIAREAVSMAEYPAAQHRHSY